MSDGELPDPRDRTYRWEIPSADWDALKETIRDRLTRSARLGHPIAYSNLVSGLAFAGPNSHALADMLGEISSECAEAHEPLLSAVAVYISGEKRGEPGPGFYAIAKHLGLLRPDVPEMEALSYWGSEAERCFDFYGRRRDKPGSR